MANNVISYFHNLSVQFSHGFGQVIYRGKAGLTNADSKTEIMLTAA